MSRLKIVEWPAKVLETKSEPVETFDDQLRKFVSDMHETMEAAHGVGLAANQVDVAKRVITIRIPFEESSEDQEAEIKQPWHNKSYTLINPKIVKKRGKIRWQEGCLSFPEIFDFVDRAEEVWVEAQNEFGEIFKLHGTGLMSVCIQHEIDHIDGIVFFKRMSRLKAGLIKKKMQKRGQLNLGE